MAEDKKPTEEKKKPSWKSKEKEKPKQESRIETAKLVRILSTDIPGEKNIYTGLTWIKGISWGMSNAICNLLKIDKKKKISDFTKDDIDKIEKAIETAKFPSFILNRRKDLETGENKHLLGSDLDLQKEFDIKRLKKIRSYRGLRHALGQPVRGQRTRSHFRKNKTVGVKKARK